MPKLRKMLEKPELEWAYSKKLLASLRIGCLTSEYDKVLSNEFGISLGGINVEM